MSEVKWCQSGNGARGEMGPEVKWEDGEMVLDVKWGRHCGKGLISRVEK